MGFLLREEVLSPCEARRKFPNFKALAVPASAQLTVAAGAIQATERALYYNHGGAPALFFTFVSQPELLFDEDFALLGAGMAQSATGPAALIRDWITVAFLRVSLPGLPASRIIGLGSTEARRAASRSDSFAADLAK
jgi:hypothetical protein